MAPRLRHGFCPDGRFAFVIRLGIATDQVMGNGFDSVNPIPWLTKLVAMLVENSALLGGLLLALPQKELKRLAPDIMPLMRRGSLTPSLLRCRRTLAVLALYASRRIHGAKLTFHNDSVQPPEGGVWRHLKVRRVNPAAAGGEGRLPVLLGQSLTPTRSPEGRGGSACMRQTPAMR